MKMMKQLLTIGCAASMLSGITLPVFAQPDTSYRQFHAKGRSPIGRQVTCAGMTGWMLLT